VLGSFILDPKNTAPGFDRGFDSYDGTFHRRKSGESRYESLERRADVVVDHALAWLAKKPPGPFFLWVHFYDPHDPYDPPEPFKSRYRSSPYDGEIAYTDAAVGRLLTALRSHGVYDGALIAVMADHGEAFGEHGEFHHGIFLYDETIHVPLLFKLPAQRGAGLRVQTRARLADVAPTILKEVGLPVPASMQGEALQPLMQQSDSQSDRTAYSQSEYARRAFGWASLEAWRAGKYLYIQAPQRELYDQSVDPDAKHNLASNASAVAETMASQSEAFVTRTSSAAKGESQLTPEQAENLRALGYMASASTSRDAPDNAHAIDPKSRIQIAELFHAALVDVEQENFEAALPKLERVLKEEPNATMAYFELGRAYVKTKQYEKAVSPLRKAIELSPNDSLAHFELGQALVKLGNWQEAVPHFEIVVQQSPQVPEMHFYLAVSYQQTQQIPGAIREFRKTLELDDDNFKANLFLGRLLGMQGDAKAALPYLLKAVKLQPESSTAHVFLANTYTQLGQKANAERERNAARRASGTENP
jgi:tetratricopeptide (TPR) repeat protein